MSVLVIVKVGGGKGGYWETGKREEIKGDE